VKEILTGFVAVILVSSVVVVSERPQPAVATVPSILSIDCTSEADIRTSLASLATANELVKQFPSSSSVAAVWVLSGLSVGNTREIANPGSANCAIAEGTALSADVTVGAGATTGILPVIGVSNSGFFTITGGTGGSVTVYIDACSLDGSGISQDPWLVGSVGDLEKVGLESNVDGQKSCSLEGHYRQFRNITPVDTVRTVRTVNGVPQPKQSDFAIARDSVTFRGVYDGDHYSIVYQSRAGLDGYEDRDPLFTRLGPGGVIKKLRLSGVIRSDESSVSSLVRSLRGGTISEVRSTVHLDVDDSNPRIGGLAADSDSFNSDTTSSGLIQYSHFSGSITWRGNSPIRPSIGGLVGQARPRDASTPRTLTIRDSYARPTISVTSENLSDDADALDRLPGLHIGGIVGVDGELRSSGSEAHRDSHLKLIRTYSAGSFTNTCVGSDVDCFRSQVNVGGLVGFSVNNTDNDIYVANYWLESFSPDAIGQIAIGVSPAAYSGNLATAVPLSSGLLSTLSSFQTKESIEGGQPGGAVISAAASRQDGQLAEQDYLWAIELGNKDTFVAQKRDDNAVPGETVTFTAAFDRKLWANSSVPPATYRTRGAVATVTAYPTLGRVWEICPEENNGYPVLVWEERTCTGGNGGGTTTASKAKPVDEAAAAIAAGLTGAELQAFLDSGLTLEEWLARRLAQTGTTAGALQLALLASGALALLGAWFVVWSNRRRHTV